MTALKRFYKVEQAFENWLILLFMLISLSSNILLSNISLTVLGPYMKPFVLGIRVPNISMPDCISFTQSSGFFSGMWSAGNILNNFSYNQINDAAVFLFTKNNNTQNVYSQTTVWESIPISGQFGIYFAVFSGLAVTFQLVFSIYTAFFHFNGSMVNNDRTIRSRSFVGYLVSYILAMITTIISFNIILTEADPIPAPIYQLQLAVSSVAFIVLIFMIGGLIIKKVVRKRFDLYDEQP